MKRAIFDICLFLSVLLLPWWVVLVLAVVGIYIFDQYYEAAVSMILIQIIYHTTGNRVISSPLYFPLIVIISYFILATLKKYILIKNI